MILSNIHVVVKLTGVQNNIELFILVECVETQMGVSKRVHFRAQELTKFHFHIACPSSHCLSCLVQILILFHFLLFLMMNLNPSLYNSIPLMKTLTDYYQ